jgi:hypothetical protein
MTRIKLIVAILKATTEYSLKHVDYTVDGDRVFMFSPNHETFHATSIIPLFGIFYSYIAHKDGKCIFCVF